MHHYDKYAEKGILVSAALYRHVHGVKIGDWCIWVFFLSDSNSDEQLKSVSKKGKKKKNLNFAGSLEGKKTLTWKLNT